MIRRQLFHRGLWSKAVSAGPLSVQGGGGGPMVADTMNTFSSTRLPARPLALPNLLTYGRIGAVPVVVALMYWHSILDGGLWLRWGALGGRSGERRGGEEGR